MGSMIGRGGIPRGKSGGESSGLQYLNFGFPILRKPIKYSEKNQSRRDSLSVVVVLRTTVVAFRAVEMGPAVLVDEDLAADAVRAGRFDWFHAAILPSLAQDSVPKMTALSFRRVMMLLFETARYQTFEGLFIRDQLYLKMAVLVALVIPTTS